LRAILLGISIGIVIFVVVIGSSNCIIISIIVGIIGIVEACFCFVQRVARNGLDQITSRANFHWIVARLMGHCLPWW